MESVLSLDLFVPALSVLILLDIVLSLVGLSVERAPAKHDVFVYVWRPDRHTLWRIAFEGCVLCLNLGVLFLVSRIDLAAIAQKLGVIAGDTLVPDGISTILLLLLLWDRVKQPALQLGLSGRTVFLFAAAFYSVVRLIAGLVLALK